MIPTSLVGVSVLVLLILPGIVLELLRQRSRPGRTDSVFVETGRVLLGGALVSAAAVLLLGIVRTIAPPVLVDPRLLWLTPRYIPDHLWLTSHTVALFLLVSATLAALCYALAPAPGLGGKVLMESAWVATFARLPHRLGEDRPKASHHRRIATQLQVELNDGTTYLGMRDAYSADTTMSERELVLAPPLHCRRPDGQFEPLEEGWQRIIIHGSQIRAILVRFTSAADSRPRPQRVHGAWITRTVSTWTASPGRLAVLLAIEIAVPVAIGSAIRLA